MFVGDDPATNVRVRVRVPQLLHAVLVDRDQAGRAAEGKISIRSLTKLPAALAALDLDKDRDAPRRLP